jgi:hypothetical protein
MRRMRTTKRKTKRSRTRTRTRQFGTVTLPGFRVPPHSSRDAATVSLSIPRNRTEQNERLDMINHNRTYSAVLGTLAAVAALSSGLLLFLAGASTSGRLDTHLPDWSLPWVAVVNFAYAIAIVVVLCARRFKPESGRRLTRLLNWALLPALPGGTLVGIYGLWRVDKATG